MCFSSLSPSGLILETSVLISFHPQFVTADDRIYVLKCLHNRPPPKKHGSGDTLLLTEGIPFDKHYANFTTHNHANDSSIEASPLLNCGYNITNEDGELLGDAAIGDTVKHRWWCLNAPSKSCLIVSNCFLKTYDSEHNLIGKDGCSSDIRVMPQLDYNNEVFNGELSMKSSNNIFFLDICGSELACFWYCSTSNCSLPMSVEFDSGHGGWKVSTSGMHHGESSTKKVCPAHHLTLQRLARFQTRCGLLSRFRLRNFI